jgi:hypothetical protein
MSAAAFYLPPILALTALSFTVALMILVSRFSEILKGERPASFFEDFDGFGASAFVMRPTRQLANLFEFPTLLYAAVAILVGSGLEDLWLLWLCWFYASLRWAHAMSHLFLNRLWLRTPVFMAGNLVLLAIWVRMSTIVLA